MSSPEEQPKKNWFSFGGFALLLAATLGICFWPVLLSGESFFYRDFGALAYPTTFYFKQSILQGDLPFWNPYSNSGAPFLAQWGTMMLYPFHYLLVILPLPWGLNFFCLLHLWWAGLGMYKLGHSLTSSSWGATVAGTAFVFNGITLSALTWPNYTVVLAWMPWVIYLSRKSWTTHAKYIPWAALAGTMQMMSGAPEIILLTWLALGAIGLADLSTDKKQAGIVMGKLILIGLLVIGLSAAQLLPFYELVQSSQRQLGVNATKWSLPYWGWANFFLPMFHAFKTPEGTYFQEGQEFLASTFIGGGLLIASFLALRHRTALRVAIAGSLLFAALLALGPSGGLYNLIQHFVPGTGLIRYPVKAVYLVAFCVALLAGCFAADLQKEPEKQLSLFRKAIIALAVIFIGLLYIARAYPLPYDRWPDTLSNSIYRVIWAMAILALFILGKEMKSKLHVAQFGLLLLLVIDAKTHLPNLNPTLPISFLEPGIWSTSHELPKPTHGNGRLFITPAAEERLLHSSIADPGKTWMGRRLACWSHLNLLELAPKVNGSSTLQLKEQSQVQNLLYSTNVFPRESWLDFLGVTHISSAESYAAWAQREVTSPYLIRAAAHPVFMADATIENELPKLDVQSNLYMPLEWKERGGSTNGALIKFGNFQFNPQKISFGAEVSQPGWITISQTWEKNWKAYVNGSRTDIARANHAFQAIWVPAGVLQVELRYEARSFNIGAAISSLSAIALMACVWRQRKVAR
ncbi:MAG: YfhO family protein [Verrucomicrobiales bacterium]